MDGILSLFRKTNKYSEFGVSKAKWNMLLLIEGMVLGSINWLPRITYDYIFCTSIYKVKLSIYYTNHETAYSSHEDCKLIKTLASSFVTSPVSLFFDASESNSLSLVLCHSTSGSYIKVLRTL